MFRLPKELARCGEARIDGSDVVSRDETWQDISAGADPRWSQDAEVPQITFFNVAPRMAGYNGAERTARSNAAPRTKLEEGAELIGTPLDEDV